MIRNTRRTVIAALLGTAIALPAWGSAVAAAPAGTGAAPGTAVITVGRLVLEPTARGYRADLPVTVTNNGTTPVHRVLITEPVPGSWRGPVGDEFCMLIPDTHPRTIDCAVSVSQGESYTFGTRFEVLTRTRPYAMSAGDGRVAAHPIDLGAPAISATRYQTVFRSTTGSLRPARPYVPARQSNASITAGPATLTRQADGTYAGWQTVSVRYRNDAPHTSLFVDSTVPAGLDIEGTDPDSGPAFATGFRVPARVGTQDRNFMQGETRTFRVLFTAKATAAPGEVGTGTYHLRVNYDHIDVTDRRPADNTVTFPVRLVDGS